MCTGGPTQLISIKEEILFGFKAFLLVVTILFIELKALSHSLDDIATVLIAVNNGLKSKTVELSLRSLNSRNPFIADLSST